MFENNGVFGSNFEDGIPGGTTFLDTPCLTDEDHTGITSALTSDDPDHAVRALRSIESQISFLESVQARISTHLDEVTNGSTDRLDTSKERGTAHQVAMARRRSQHSSLAYVRRMRFLLSDMPYLFSRFQHGDFSEKLIMAMLAPLDDAEPSERRDFDRYFARHPSLFDNASIGQARDTVQKAVDEARDEERVEDIEEKTAQRGVSFVKGKDCVNMNVQLPIEVGVAIDDALEHEAQKIKKTGDKRTIKQLKADILVAKLTGHSAQKPLPIKLHINLVMTDMALLMEGDEPASIPGYGSIPARYARRLAETYERFDDFTPTDQLEALRDRIRTIPMIRRLYTLPGRKDLVAVDSKERLFKGSLRKLLQLRDPYCRTPYCNNKPRHADHIEQHSKGGKTSSRNGGMKCAFCNLAKEAPGWTEEVVQECPHKIKIKPPGTVEFESTSPPLVGLTSIDEELTQMISSRQRMEAPRRGRMIFYKPPDAS